ncbi:MAG: putative glycoside hydrolase [Patescibacteria group bacterium]
MKKIIKKKRIFLIFLAGFLLVVLAYFIIPEIYNFKYNAKLGQSNHESILPNNELPQAVSTPENAISVNTTTTVKVNPEDAVVVTHIDTPSPVKAVYMSSWVAGNLSFRNKIFDMIKRTELNAVVIDVKDSTGHISFSVSNPELIKMGSVEKRVKDIKSFIDELHKNNIYVIGRIATFQDPYFAKKYSEFAVKKRSDKTALWADDKCKRAIRRHQEKLCTYWLDAGTKEVWDYVVAIGHEAYMDGFDELNFDYIRYPADGDLKDIYYPVSNGKIRAEVMKSFFTYLHDSFAGVNNEVTLRPKISADIFGLATTEDNDLGIGQMLIPVSTYFDYVAPMDYPSHFASDTYGYKNPATKPYEIVNFSMKKAVERLKTAGIDSLKLRPWLQDFNLGAQYTPEMVRAQIKAVDDAGLNSWMLWDPENTYTEDALLPQ